MESWHGSGRRIVVRGLFVFFGEKRIIENADYGFWLLIQEKKY
jgi:hypothetical protein